MIIMVLQISYCLSIPVDDYETMNGERQKRNTLNFGPPGQYQMWRDGNQMLRFGPPRQHEMWRDAGGTLRFGPPRQYEMWRSN